MKKAEIFIRNFLQQESAAGILLIFTTIFAVLVANSPFDYLYDMLLDTKVAIQVGALKIDKPLLLWVNDGLMAVFFFLVGLELKREFLEGELKDKKNIIFPAFGAVGGMVVPALFYIYFNHDTPNSLKGWAIPTATDIAFVLGILSLLGSRIPLSLKVFLTSLAIFDDIGAIAIIALFFTSNISKMALIIVIVSLGTLYVLNKKNIISKSIYIFVGLIMWVAMLKSGIHATLTGVLLALFIPIRNMNDSKQSPLKELESDLHTTVAFIILPLFAFCNAGISVASIQWKDFMHPVTLGISTGLFLGKPIGVFSFCWLSLKLGLCTLPKGITLKNLYGSALLCGIGFTMSLFIGSLVFEETGVNVMFDERLGILLGSLLSSLAGYFFLKNSKAPAK